MLALSNLEQIGCPGKIVEIDESKFAKRKYNKGHKVYTDWVFGGVERGEGDARWLKCFMVPVEDRKAKTLVDLIKRHIAPGSIIYSDCWKAYDQLRECDFIHMKVNHSLHFIDPDTGVHTNTIEGAWQKAKHGVHMPTFGTKNSHLAGYLAVYIWCKNHQNSDYFFAFLDEVKKVYNGRCPDGCEQCT